MSDEAVDISVRDAYQMSDREALEYLVRARWGSRTSVRCPHCGTIAGHYWRPKDRRWTCRGCRKAFSVTSNTVFANRKLALQDLIAGTLMWVNSAGGQPALELKRHWNTTYNTAYVLQHKVREALVRGYNVGLLAGDLEMDGSHQSGWRAAEKRGKPQVSAAPTDEEVDAVLMSTSERSKKRQRARKKGAFNPEFGARLPEHRRIVIAIRKRSGVKGMGAVETRVAVGVAENDDVVRAVIGDFVACSESYLNTDEAPVYTKFARSFRGHKAVKHSVTMKGPNGEHNNMAEELNARMDRAEKGQYMNIEPKYLLDYAVEVAFRSDTRRMSNGAQLRLALNIALNVGTSQFWRGFTQGRHRTQELLHPKPRAARASGPLKGRSPIAAANGRPPR
jgi:transposase-like protein